LRKTAEFIEESKNAKSLTSGKPPAKRISGGRGSHPNSRKNLLISPFPKGVSGNPGGKPKFDWGAHISQAVIEGNREAIYRALTKAALKGNAYVFQVLCDRGYGKVMQGLEISDGNEEPSLEELNAQLEELMRKSLSDPMCRMGQRMRELVREADAKEGAK
jgi:hypothetical protein